MKKFLAAAALSLAFIAPISAYAVTTPIDITAGEIFSGNGLVTPDDDTVSFVFTALEALTVGTISLTGNGPTPNVAAISVEIAPSGSASPFTQVFTAATQQIGFSFPAGFFLALGDQFSINFTGDVGADVDVDFNFSTVVAPVPVPAAGGMLLTAVIAGGIAARRKAKKA